MQRTIFALLLLLPIASGAQTPVTIVHEGGGPVSTAVGTGGSVLNDSSSLERDAITIRDARVPLRIEQNVGVRTFFQGRSYGYQSVVTIIPTEDLRAAELRFVLFDVWGNPVRTLTTTLVADMAKGTARTIRPEWPLFSEAEAKNHFASIAYVARVRTTAGRVIVTDPAPVLAEAMKMAKLFTAADLEPAKSTPTP